MASEWDVVETKPLSEWDVVSSEPLKSAKKTTKAKPSYGDLIKPEFETYGNLLAGAVRGAGSIGATIVGARDAAEQGIANLIGAKDYIAGVPNRRAEMTNALQTMGADPNSLAFQGAKMGTEVAGTLGAGPALGAGATALNMPRFGAALTSFGGGAGQGANLLQRIGGGAIAGGAGAGLIDPETAMYGAIVGGIAPQVVNAIGSAGNWISRRASEARDLFRGGDEGAINILRRYISSPKAVGTEAMPGVIQAARNAPEIIPGGAPTVAEAVVGQPGASPISALQRIVSKTGGGASDKFTARLAEQDAAIEAAKAARSAASTINYGKAFDTKLNPVSAYLGKVQDPQLRQIVDNPYFKDAVPSALKLAKAKGITSSENITEFLHDVKLGLDKKLQNKGDLALDAAQYREVQKVKSQLVDWLKNKNPAYEFGREQHRQASKLIEDYVARQEAALNPLVKTNLGGGVNVAEETRQHLPNLLSRTAMSINYALKAAGKNVEPKVDRLAADLFLNPKRFAEEMSKLPPEVQLNIGKALQATNALTLAGASAQ